MEVNIHEAKTHLSKLIEKALAGEAVVIAKAGKPMVRLAPILQSSRRELGSARELAPKNWAKAGWEKPLTKREMEEFLG
jgi:prevent-host-death family protein